MMVGKPYELQNLSFLQIKRYKIPKFTQKTLLLDNFIEIS